MLSAIYLSALVTVLPAAEAAPTQSAQTRTYKVELSLESHTCKTKADSMDGVTSLTFVKSGRKLRIDGTGLPTLSGKAYRGGRYRARSAEKTFPHYALTGKANDKLSGRLLVTKPEGKSKCTAVYLLKSR